MGGEETGREAVRSSDGKGDCETAMGKNTTNRVYCQDKYIPYVYHWKDRS